MDAAVDYGLPENHVIYLAADPERDAERVRAKSTRENVQATFADSTLAATAAATTDAAVVLWSAPEPRGGPARSALRDA